MQKRSSLMPSHNQVCHSHMYELRLDLRLLMGASHGKVLIDCVCVC
jgi:hypothetical protein